MLECNKDFFIIKLTMCKKYHVYYFLCNPQGRFGGRLGYNEKSGLIWAIILHLNYISILIDKPNFTMLVEPGCD